MKTALAVLGLALVAFAPTALAQGDVTGIAIDGTTGAGTVPFEGSGSLGVQGSVGCATLLQAGGGAVELSVVDAPAWLTATPKETEADEASCLTSQGRAPFTGGIDFTVSADAPAVVQHVIGVQAAIGSESATSTATVSVAYVSNYTVVPSITFPFNLTEPTLTFTVTGTQASNAPSMIMVDSFSASDGALVSGFGALQYNNDAGKPDTKTYNIVFTPPTTDWQTSTITLKVYGHYNFPDGSAAGEPMDHKTIAWQVVNGGVESDGGDKDGKDSPAPVAMVTALGLLGFAALRRRRE